MANNSESGHAVNVANFSELITFVAGYGEAYNPSNNQIKLLSLQEISSIAAESLAGVNTTIPAYNSAVASREILFLPLSKLVTRVMNSLKASGVSEQVYDQVLTVARKVKGTRATAIVEPVPAVEGETPVKEVRHVSSSQMSFDSRAENFGKLVTLLAAIEEYTPNEDDLKVTTLNEWADELKAKNNAVIVSEVPWSNARIARNSALYSDVTGLCDTAMTVKNYVKAVFGSSSPQFKQISKLQFKRLI